MDTHIPTPMWLELMPWLPWLLGLIPTTFVGLCWFVGKRVDRYDKVADKQIAMDVRLGSIEDTVREIKNILIQNKKK